MPIKQKKQEQITVRLTQQQAQFLDTRVAQKGGKATRSKIIRNILDKAIAAKKYYSK